LTENPQERLFNLAANFPILARTIARIAPPVQGQSLTMVVAIPLLKESSTSMKTIMRPACRKGRPGEVEDSRHSSVAVQINDDMIA
jgi:hypothetical protein